MSPIFLLLVILLIAFLPVLSWFYYDKLKVFMRKVKAFILCDTPPPDDHGASPMGPTIQQVYFIGCERIKIEPLPNIEPSISPSQAPTSSPPPLPDSDEDKKNMEKY